MMFPAYKISTPSSCWKFRKISKLPPPLKEKRKTTSCAFFRGHGEGWVAILTEFQTRWLPSTLGENGEIDATTASAPTYRGGWLGGCLEILLDATSKNTRLLFFRMKLVWRNAWKFQAHRLCLFLKDWQVTKIAKHACLDQMSHQWQHDKEIY